MLKIIVYKTTNLINNKIYIGVHGTYTDEFDGYIGCGIQCKSDLKRKNYTKFHKAVIKYGYDNFKRETLFEYPWTKQGIKDAYKKEEELVDRDFIKRDDVYNMVLGGKVPSSIFEKPVAQYTMDGKFIKFWNSLSEVQRELKINTSCISHACLKKSYSNGFQWRYFNGDTSDIDPITINEKVVYQFDLQGNYLNYYKSLHEAERQTGISFKSIYAVCCDKQTQAGGYYWNYKKKFEYRTSKTNTAVASYTREGVFIKSYNNIKSAAAEINVTPGSIYDVILGRHKTCKNLRWRYFYGNSSNIKSL